jgi:hypothetical protein
MDNLITLKAQAFDILRQIEYLQMQLQQVNQSIVEEEKKKEEASKSKQLKKVE